MRDTETVGMILRIVRVANDLSITEVNRKCSVSRSYLSEVERGKKQISLKKQMELLKVYGISINQFKEICDYYRQLKSDKVVLERYQLTLLICLNMLIKNS